MLKNVYLCEVSWEVCNKVGGINTVIRSKIPFVTQYFKNNYLLIGPWLEGRNNEFVEKNDLAFKPMKEALSQAGFSCRFGYWDVKEKPLVILVDFRNRYKVNELLYGLWNDFGIDSLASNYDYIEPVLFATASAEVIKILVENKCLQNADRIIAHFHEWLTGAGVLYLKKNLGQVATVFTIHATVLGRALSGNKRSIYQLSPNFNATNEARTYGVFAKHSIERAAAEAADCFTAVSEITADEAKFFLNKYPNKIIPNGFDPTFYALEGSAQKAPKTRSKLLAIAERVLGRSVPKNSILWVTSGRFEFHNKGYDILLSALARLKDKIAPDAPPIIVFFLIAAKQYSEKDLASGAFLGEHYSANPSDIVGISTHPITDPQHDIIIQRSTELKLRQPDSKIRIIYSNAYLDGTDGVFNLPYSDILAACDLSIFPSFYEPWGYTPLESITAGTPTITTNLSGFGHWVSNLSQDYEGSITILDTKCFHMEKIIVQLAESLFKILQYTPEQMTLIRVKAKTIAELASWSHFYPLYLEAYQQALDLNETLQKARSYDELTAHIAPTESTTPYFRWLQYEAQLPDNLKELRDFIYNYWWSWNEEGENLFIAIDSALWDKVQRHPVVFLSQLSNKRLNDLSKNKDFLQKYHSIISKFQQYLEDKTVPEICEDTSISLEHPIAYFCMEYGIESALPIYSGGLGVLAGDYLKTISDLNIPMVAIGLFYKQGYFRQSINSRGEQVENYDVTNPKHLPLKEMTDTATGKSLLVNVEILGRTVYSRIWKAEIGRVPLYLLDTDIPENSADDRAITSSLYGGSREIRLMQEKILGIGGVRLLLEKLNLTPSLYHLNEGHSAFLLLERIKYYRHLGYSFSEALETVRSSSVFTTHTPVPAGNDVFALSLIKQYFTQYAGLLGLSIEQFLKFAEDRLTEHQDPIFSMTVLALRLSLGINAVSQLHQQISCSMWSKIWPGFLLQELPIKNVTNGIHLKTWLGPDIQTLYSEYFGLDWKNDKLDPNNEKNIDSISDRDIWHAHQTQKGKLLDLLKNRIKKEYAARNESKSLINDSLGHLKEDVLFIGMARRFTAYKRNDLILRDKERLAKLLTQSKKSGILIVAGKAHPADKLGKAMIQSLLTTLRDPIFEGRIIFLENYDIALAKALVQGIDVWINTPLRGKEACGTSGMKVNMNGGLQISTQDGWWAEIDDSKAGWTISSFEEASNESERNDLENFSLLEILENSVFPLYYSSNSDANLPTPWVQKLRSAMSYITHQFNTERMVHDYFKELYCPVSEYSEHLMKNDRQNLKTIAQWKETIGERFSTVKVKDILVEGLKEGNIATNGVIKVKVILFPGKLTTSEIKVEFILWKHNKLDATPPEIFSLNLLDTQKTDVLTYTAEMTIKETGFYQYGVRIYPYHPLLKEKTDASVVMWS